jgi:RimJ/RimL family protein N-acetyltransferase
MNKTYSKIIQLKSGKEVLLRTPTVTDAQALADYINELVDEDTFISSRKQTAQDEESYITSMLKKIDAGKEVHIVGIVDNKKVAAIDIFSQGVRKEHVGELQINIHKDYRGEGLGKILMEEALTLAKDVLKLNIITLTCFSVNTVALSLYNKYGFQEFGRLPKGLSYKGEYVDEVYMYKEL